MQTTPPNMQLGCQGMSRKLGNTAPIHCPLTARPLKRLSLEPQIPNLSLVGGKTKPEPCIPKHILGGASRRRKGNADFGALLCFCALENISEGGCSAAKLQTYIGSKLTSSKRLEVSGMP